MPIKNIDTNNVGKTGVEPSFIFIETDDTLATVTTAGYLNNAKTKDGLPLKETMMALVTTKTTPSATTSQVALLEVSKSGNNWSLSPTGSPGEVTLPTTANYLAHFSNTTGTLADTAADVINPGDIQAGLSGTAGKLVSYPGTAAKGSFEFEAVANTGDTTYTLRNAASGQASVVTFPDPGAATANVVLTASALSTQSIGTGISITGAANNVQTTGGGNLIAGSSGAAGSLFSYPTTASKGSLEIRAADNTGDTDVVITNAAHGQATVYTISDCGEAAGSLLVNVLDAADPNANVVTFDVTVGQAALASAGTVTLQASSGAKQYKIRELYLNSGGTNFSGGGGDRLATISDGTTDYSVIPAATLQSLANARWGDTGLPFPASAAINTSTAAGVAVTIAYSGGTTDYTAGELVISGVLERVA